MKYPLLVLKEAMTSKTIVDRGFALLALKCRPARKTTPKIIFEALGSLGALAAQGRRAARSVTELKAAPSSGCWHAPASLARTAGANSQGLATPSLPLCGASTRRPRPSQRLMEIMELP